MSGDLYADGVMAIRLANGMIRLEFGVLSIHESDENGSPKVETAFRLAMTPKGFLKTFGKMEQMVQVLKESGVVIDTKGLERRDGPARNQALSLASDDRRAPSHAEKNNHV